MIPADDNCCPYFTEVFDNGSPDGELLYCDRPRGHDDMHHNQDCWSLVAAWELDTGLAANSGLQP